MAKRCEDCFDTGYMGGGKAGIYCPCLRGTLKELEDGEIPTLEKVSEFLGKRGYKGGELDSFTKAHLFYRRVRKRHQYCVYFYELVLNGERHVSFEVTMSFNTIGDVWSQIKFYSIPWKVLQEDIADFEQRLIASVVSMGGHPQLYNPG